MSAPATPQRPAARAGAARNEARRLWPAGGRRLKGRSAARPIEMRRDLARLPEPRFLGVAPWRLRWLSTGAMALMAVFGAVGLAAFFSGAPQTPPFGSAIAALALAGGLGGLAIFRPQDWRGWIVFAAVPGGLYLPGRGRRVVFVPWFSVLDIAGVDGQAKAGRGHVRLTLRLDRQNWSRLSRLLNIDGQEEVRSLALPGHGLSPDEAAARIAALQSHDPLAKAS